MELETLDLLFSKYYLYKNYIVKSKRDLSKNDVIYFVLKYERENKNTSVIDKINKLKNKRQHIKNKKDKRIYNIKLDEEEIKDDDFDF